MTRAEFDDLPRIAQDLIPDFHPDGPVTSLVGGLLNHVYRISGNPYSVIAKYAPPYVAANPKIPLDPERQMFEAKALSLFKSSSALHSLVTPYLRIPELLAYQSELSILFMEDAGRETRSLDSLPHPETDDVKMAATLGKLIAGIHAETMGNTNLSKNLNNASIQKTRYMVQYQPATRYFLKAGIPDYETLGRKLEILGREFMNPGICMTMGDLWPRSLLWNDHSWYLIDWEFAHFGSPAQDIGHLIAHLWMLERRSPNPGTAKRFSTIRNAFIQTYGKKIDDLRPSLFSRKIQKQAVLHAAAEILARTTGAFQDGYIYAGLEPDDPAIQEAVRKAAEWVRNAETTDTHILAE